MRQLLNSRGAGAPRRQPAPDRIAPPPPGINIWLYAACKFLLKSSSFPAAFNPRSRRSPAPIPPPADTLLFASSATVGRSPWNFLPHPTISISPRRPLRSPQPASTSEGWEIKAFELKRMSHSPGLWCVSTATHLVLMTCSCGFYRTINNAWLYFLCVVSHRRLTRGDETAPFLSGRNISRRVHRPPAATISPG